MAFSFNMKAIVLIEFLLVLNGYIFDITNGAPLNDVCNQALDSSFCLYDFGLNPATKTADLPLLAQIAIDRAEVNATVAETQIRNLISSTADPQLRSFLVQCDDSYVGALNALRMAPDDLDNERYRDLSLHGGMTSDAGARCETLFQNSFKSPLTSENQSLRLLGDIINIIANDLNCGE